MFLFVLANRENFFIFLEHLPVLDMTIHCRKSVKSLSRDRLGQNVLFSFDESNRILAVWSSVKVLWSFVIPFVVTSDVHSLQLQLYVFTFGENFKTLQEGGAINLADRYRQPGISIIQMTSVCGRKEVALVDSRARVRVLSFVTGQFRFVSYYVNFAIVPQQR